MLCEVTRELGFCLIYKNASSSVRAARPVTPAEFLALPRRVALLREPHARFESTWRDYRQRQPGRDRAYLRLNEVEGEIENITKAIKAGIFTPTTKAELEKAESERTRLQQAVSTATANADKVVTMLPRAKERYRDLIKGIGALSAKHLPRPVSRCGVGRGHPVDADEGGLPGGDPHRTVCGAVEIAEWRKVKS